MDLGVYRYIPRPKLMYKRGDLLPHRDCEGVLSEEEGLRKGVEGDSACPSIMCEEMSK